MKDGHRVNVVIPALNEEQAIPRVLPAIPAWVDRVIVVDNGSTDRTAHVAASGGAHVVHEPRRGYGAACLAGIAAIEHADVVVFLDADYSDDPAIMEKLVAPIIAGRADLVIGSRVLGQAEPGSLTLPQRFGNALACTLMRWGFAARHTDLGPFRAVSLPSLRRMRMSDRTYGWTIEMQVRAARLALRVLEVPVPYRRRIGQSKISGTIRGVIGAGTKILGTLAVERWRHSFGSPLDATRRRLVVFARFPQPGRTKTRLIPALGAEGAARLHVHMIRRTMHRAGRLRGVGVELHHDGGSESDWRTMLAAPAGLRAQSDGDLGARLRNAFDHSFARGDEIVVAVGTDCPFLERRVLNEAFAQLRRHDMVIGPAVDGGYYLLGLRRGVRSLFEGIDWGSERVFAQTLARAAEAGLDVHQLRLLRDIDTPDDLAAFAPGALLPGRRQRVSVVITVGSAEERVAAAIASARDRHDAQVIVVDGGGGERCGAIAAAMGAEVIHASANRAKQMNLGARAATGDVLVFLCGDSMLPPGYVPAIHAALSRPGVIAGTVRLGVAGGGKHDRLMATWARSQVRKLALHDDDQALFIRAREFQACGGFREG